VAVLVEDHLGVLGVVDAALAEAQDVVLVPRVRVVDPELVHADVLLLAVDRPQLGAEPEALQVQLRLRDPVVRHDLLEALGVAPEPERVRRRVEGRARLAADAGPVAAEAPAPVEVREHDVVVRRRERRVVGVLLVGQRLVLQLGDRVRQEDGADTGPRAVRRFRGERAGDEHRRGDGRGPQDERTTHV